MIFPGVDSVGDRWWSDSSGAYTTVAVESDYYLWRYNDPENEPGEIGRTVIRIRKNGASPTDNNNEYRGNGTFVIKEASGTYASLLGATGILQYLESLGGYNEELHVYIPTEYEMTLDGYVKK